VAITDHFRDMVTAAIPLQMKTWLLLRAYVGSRKRPIRWCHCRLPTAYSLATIPHNWHTIMRY